MYMGVKLAKGKGGEGWSYVCKRDFVREESASRLRDAVHCLVQARSGPVRRLES